MNNSVTTVPEICIYHGNCADGFGAAVAVKMAKPGVELIPGVYQTPPPDVKGKVVYIVDFSYKRPIMEQMCRDAHQLVVLDHHKSARENLEGLADWSQQNCGFTPMIHFDMEQSGAMMAWRFFHPHTEVPELIQYIQDRDLWQFKLPMSREVSMALFSYEYDYTVWEGFMTNIFAVDNLAKEGIPIVRKHDKDIAEFLAVATQRQNIAGHNVPVINAPYMWASDACHVLCKGEPFAASYYQTADGVVFSLRSEEGGVDVSEIATKFGGGGHKHAAGFTVGVHTDVSLGHV